MSANGQENPSQQTVLFREVEEFLIDREARLLTPKTLRWYRDSLAIFRDHLDAQGVTATAELTPAILRQYILHLSQRGHSHGGVVNIFSAARAYLNWYDAEYGDWDNPLRRVKPPKRTNELEQPISPEDFRALVATCSGNGFEDSRDRAAMFVLIDSGVRKQELADLQLDDVDMKTGAILVRSGKGRKTRTVFVSAKTRRMLAKYFRNRPEGGGALWVKSNGEALTPAGLRQIIRRRANQAGIHPPGFHEFRRAFAINALRSGMDLVTLQRMLGHSNLNVINRYLALVDDDLREAHRKHSPVDWVMDS